jgi:conjugal transfer pilus assembly protein TraE
VNLDAFHKNFRVMQAENSWGRLIIALSLVAILFLAIIAFFRKPVVMLVPPHLTEEAELHHNKAQAGIHSAWGLFMAETLGNVTPDTASFVRNTIEPLLGPKIYNDALRLLDQQIDDIKRDRVSFSFEPREVIFDDKTGTAYVVGRHYTHQGIGNADRVNRTYEFRWEFENYMPRLVYLNTYEGAPRVKQKQEQKKD